MAKHKLKPGDRVRSHFRSPWIGTVIDADADLPHCVWVLVTHDRKENVIPKSILKRIDQAWLEKLPADHHLVKSPL